MAVVASAGCGGARSADQDALIAGFDAAVTAVQVTHVVGPNETTSKDLAYMTGSGLNDAPEDESIVQIAPANAGLAWTPE